MRVEGRFGACVSDSLNCCSASENLPCSSEVRPLRKAFLASSNEDIYLLVKVDGI